MSVVKFWQLSGSKQYAVWNHKCPCRRYVPFKTQPFMSHFFPVHVLSNSFEGLQWPSSKRSPPVLWVFLRLSYTALLHVGLRWFYLLLRFRRMPRSHRGSTRCNSPCFFVCRNRSLRRHFEMIMTICFTLLTRFATIIFCLTMLCQLFRFIAVNWSRKNLIRI